ncbi:hypothetical protein L6386_00085 [bacterium]|nr:hypothetical protein [bacterium]MBU4310977.1 hypothetical protein [bacterium]MCG2676913.1 hypothetical protein [bacterium]MCG2676954.1 hypothetical protein [bacterium]
MKIKSFLKPNAIKVSLFIGFIVFLPTVVFLGAAGGLVPPIFILVGSFFALRPPIIFLILFLTSGISLVIDYVISCICYKMISFVPNKKIQIGLTVLIIVCLIIWVSFNKVYYFADCGGGGGAFSLLDIFKRNYGP